MGWIKIYGSLGCRIHSQAFLKHPIGQRQVQYAEVEKPKAPVRAKVVKWTPLLRQGRGGIKGKSRCSCQ